MDQTALDQAKASLGIETQAIESLKLYLDWAAFSRAVDALCSCRKIVTCGSGSSGIAAMKFAHSLCCVERPAKFIPPSEAVHGGLGYVQEGDVVVVVSRGGKTVELLPIIDVCNQKKTILIGVTENLDSPLAQKSDIVIPIRIAREADSSNVMATASFVTIIAIFDAMLVAIIEQTGFTSKQFALNHRGGAVGELLNKIPSY